MSPARDQGGIPDQVQQVFKGLRSNLEEEGGEMQIDEQPTSEPDTRKRRCAHGEPPRQMHKSAVPLQDLAVYSNPPNALLILLLRIGEGTDSP